MDRARWELSVSDASRIRMLMEQYGRIWAKMSAQIRDLAEVAGTNPNKQAAMERVQELQRQLEYEMRYFARTADAHVMRGVEEGAVQAARDARSFVLSKYEAEEPDSQAVLQQLWNYVDPETFKSISWLTSPESPLRHRMEELLPSAIAQGVADTMVQGVTEGWGPGRTLRECRNQFGQGLNWSFNQIRTAHMYAYRQGTLEAWRNNRDVVGGWIWRSSRNHRTCMSCLVLDGREFPLSEPMRDHYSGRCQMEPITKTWKELGIEGLDETQGRGRRETGLQWFLSQDEDLQRKMMGPKVFEAWKAGQIHIDNFVGARANSIYGLMYQKRSLKSMRSMGPTAGVLPGKPPKLPPTPPKPPPAVAGGAAPKTEEPPKVERGRARAGDEGPKTRAEAKKMAAEVRESLLKHGVSKSPEEVALEKDIERTRRRLADQKAQGRSTTRLHQSLKHYERELERMRKLRNKQASDLLRVAEGDLWGFTSAGKVSDHLQARLSEAIDWLDDHVDGYGASFRARVQPMQERRAFCQRLTMWLCDKSGYTDMATVVHEWGHVLEHHEKAVHREAVDFLKARTKGERETRIYPNRPDLADEVGWKDKFRDHYVGKHYSRMFSTEIVSMGLQYMVEDPVAFAQEDPEHFDLIYRVMRGWVWP
jgi:hypothetical protein